MEKESPSAETRTAEEDKKAEGEEDSGDEALLQELLQKEEAEAEAAKKKEPQDTGRKPSESNESDRELDQAMLMELLQKADETETPDEQQKTAEQPQNAGTTSIGMSMAVASETGTVTGMAAEPLAVVDKNELESKFVSKCKPVQYLEDNQKYTSLQINRMTYCKLDNIGAAFAKPGAERMGGSASCMASHGITIFLGNSQGFIRVFDHQGSEKRSLFTKEAHGLKVACIDVNPSGTQLAAGFERGAVAFWDLQKQSLLRWAAKVHSAPILNLRYLKGPRVWVVSADSNGDVMLTEVTKALFGYTHTSLLLMKDKYGFSLNPLYPSELYPSKVDEATILAIGDVTSVVVVMIEPEHKLLWQCSRHDITQHSLPCVDWGRGALPNDLENSSRVLAIAWDTIIQLVEVRDPLIMDYGYLMNGYYVSEYEIIAMYWLAESVLLIINSKKEFHLLYTGNFSPGQCTAVTVQGLHRTLDSQRSLLEPPYKLTEELDMQVITLRKQGLNEGSGETLKRTYNQTVVRKGHQVLALVNGGVLVAKLSTWNDYLEQLRGSSQWLNALRVSIDIYTGALKGFANVPLIRDWREASLRAFMKNFLCESLMQNLEAEGESKPGVVSSSARTQVQVTIEYCILISAFDLLFKSLFDLFRDYSLEGVAIKSLKPFILTGKFAVATIPTHIFKKIIDHYLEKHKYRTLEQLLLCLDLSNQDLSSLTELCRTHQLSTALIYIKTRTNNEDEFIEPLSYLLQTMRTAPKDDKLNLQQLESDRLKVEASQVYLHYKLLWYMGLTFEGNKYPGRGSIGNPTIPYDLWPRVVHRTLTWLQIPQDGRTPLVSLLELDYRATFQVLRKLFENGDTRVFITDPAKFTPPGSKGFHYNQILDMLNLALDQLPSTDQQPRLYAYCEFVAKIGSMQGIALTPETITKTTLLLCEWGQEKGSRTTDASYFEGLLIGMLTNNPNLQKEHIEKMVEGLVRTPYVEVLIHVMELNADYKGCFETFLSASTEATRTRIFAWLTHIRETLEEGSKSYKQLQELISERLETLAKSDVPKTVDVISGWFQQKHDMALSKLVKYPALQLDYIGRLLSSQETEIEQLCSDLSVGVKESETSHMYQHILQLHVELLCQHRPQDLMTQLKKKYYPVQACLEVCTRHQQSEAVAFLLKRAGDFPASLTAYMQLMSGLAVEMCDDKKKSCFEANANEYRRYFLCAVKVCSKHASLSRLEDPEQRLWFLLLDELYEYWLRLYKAKNERTGVPAGELLLWCVAQDMAIAVANDCIKKLLGHMMNSIPFSTILRRVTDSHAELEIECFKELFTSTLLSYFHQENILGTAGKILGRQVVQETQQLFKAKSNGIYIKTMKCAACSKPIEKRSAVEALTFPCRHIYHRPCLRSSRCSSCVEQDPLGHFLNALNKKSLKASLPESAVAEEQKVPGEAPKTVASPSVPEPELQPPPEVDSRGSLNRRYNKRLLVFEKRRPQSFKLLNWHRPTLTPA